MTTIDTSMCTESAHELYFTTDESQGEREERVDSLRCKLDWNRPVLNTLYKSDEKKVEKRMKALDATVNAEVGGTITWGGSDGTKASGYASGSAQDNSGNYVRAEIRQNSNGEGSASVAGGVNKEVQDNSSSDKKEK